MSGSNFLSLRRADMPATCRSAADMSARGQKRTKRLVSVELIAIVLAGAFGVTSWRVGPAELDVLAALAGALFLLALATMIYRSQSKPEQQWYAGRAGAESVRTLAWRYAVGGDPFPHVLDDATAATHFLDRLARVLKHLETLELAPATAREHELSEAMQRVRKADFTESRAVYKRDRIENQITWYTGKADSHDRAANRWWWASVLASGFGLVAAGLRFVGWSDLDLLGVAGACASGAIAWNQLNQNRALVAAYRLTARELSIIRDRVEHTDESDWAVFVSDSEDAVSREHTMWLARHGHPGIRT